MILVTGESGQLGTAFKPLLPDALYPLLEEFDLSVPDRVYDACAEYAPEAIINCAAYTAVDAAETDEAVATRINGDSVGEMARYAADRGVPFVTFSTDYVFPGTAERPYFESDSTDPVNAYGRSKERGERLALAYPTTLVIRTSWLISSTHDNFVSTMLRVAGKGQASVVNDQYGCPTVASDLAVAALNALEARASGLLHLTNQGGTTWFELARSAVEFAGLDPERIAPCGSADYPTAAARPTYSILASERLEEIGLEPLPQWRDSLPDVVAGLLAR